MCVAVPTRIIEIQNDTALIDVDGVRRKTSLLLLENPKVGDYVIVHAGYAIHIVDEAEAMETLRMLREILGKE